MKGNHCPSPLSVLLIYSKLLLTEGEREALARKVQHQSKLAICRDSRFAPQMSMQVCSVSKTIKQEDTLAFISQLCMNGKDTCLKGKVWAIFQRQQCFMCLSHFWKWANLGEQHCIVVVGLICSAAFKFAFVMCVMCWLYQGRYLWFLPLKQWLFPYFPTLCQTPQGKPDSSIYVF